MRAVGFLFNQSINQSKTLFNFEFVVDSNIANISEENKMEKSSSKQKEKGKGQKADKKKRQSTTEPITPEAPH